MPARRMKPWPRPPRRSPCWGIWCRCGCSPCAVSRNRAAEALAKIFRTPEGRKTVNAQRMASLLREAGRAAEALKWIAEWKSLAPGAPQPWLLESEILEDEGRAKEAVTAMRQAVQKFDKDQDLKARLARLYRAAGQPGDAAPPV